MKSRKKLVAILSVVVFVGSMSLLRIMYGPVLNDPEYDRALQRAEEHNFPGTTIAKEYPFSTITRAESAEHYVKLAQLLEMVPVRSQCSFDDIQGLTEETQQQIILACQYGFFSGSNGSFIPAGYLTKGTSMVALMRGILPAREFRQEEKYWIPYIEAGNDLGITKRAPGPYVNYLITRYELLLQFYRAYNLKN